MAKRVFIGFTGSLGSGCTTAAKQLSQKGYKYISISSDILAPFAAEKNMPFSTGEEKQNFGNVARKLFRDEYKKRFLNAVDDGTDKIVIESFRNPIEIDFF
ncbi:MAG: hypothetical protein M0Z52_05460 [Actinomycetota bacterium]|nr:hypothetical protein [Actinomycetota bacterium]